MSTNRLGTLATTVRSFPGEHGLDVVVQYHQTDVVRFDNNRIILDTGGWFTNTTKVRMNQASNQFSLGYQVYQKNGQWFVSYDERTIPFVGNSVTFERKY